MPFYPFIKNAKVTVDGTVASDEVKSVKFTPTITTVAWDPVSGNSVADATQGMWTCELIYGQDWDTAGSLAHLLHEGFGEDLELVFSPKGNTGTWTVTVSAVPGTIGGAAGVAESTVTLPCKGKPFWEAGA